MHPQLLAIETEFESALVRLRELVEDHDEDAWSHRPAPDSWSAGECVAHLNLTAQAYLRVIPEAIEKAKSLTEPAPKRFGLDFRGWMVKQVSGSDVRFRVKTSTPFIPSDLPPRDLLVSEFERLQSEQIACVRAADGLPIHKVRIASPFATNLQYSLYSALVLLPAHQHRHLGQAERALDNTD